MNSKRWIVCLWICMAAFLIPRAYTDESLLSSTAASQPVADAAKRAGARSAAAVLPMIGQHRLEKQWLTIEVTEWEVDTKKLRSLLKNNADPVRSFLELNRMPRRSPVEQLANSLLNELATSPRFEVNGIDISSTFSEPIHSQHLQLAGGSLLVENGRYVTLPAPANQQGPAAIVNTQRFVGSKWKIDPSVIAASSSSPNRLELAVAVEHTRREGGAENENQVEASDLVKRSAQGKTTARLGLSYLMVNGTNDESLTLMATIKITRVPQIFLSADIFTLDLTTVPAVPNEAHLRQRLQPMAQKLGWKTLQDDVAWHSTEDLNNLTRKAESYGLKNVRGHFISALDGRHESVANITWRMPISSPSRSASPVFRSPGFTLGFVPTLLSASRLKLDTTMEIPLLNISTNQEMAADSKPLEVPGPLQKRSSTNELEFEECVIYALPTQLDKPSIVTLVAITPALAIPQNPLVAQQTPVSGLSHIAGSSTIDVPNVTLLPGLYEGQKTTLLHYTGEGQATRVQVVVPAAELVAINAGGDSKDPERRTVSLKIVAGQRLSLDKALKPELGAKLILTPTPTANQVDELAHPRRWLEHASIRASITALRSQEKNKEPVALIEVAPNQKVVRMPVHHTSVLLLRTPHGANPAGSYFCEIKGTEPGTKRIGDLTVVLVSETVSQLEALIQEIEPTAQVSVIELRNSALLRGTTADAPQIKSIVEIAEQFYPRVLNQLRVKDISPVMVLGETTQDIRGTLPSRIQQVEAQPKSRDTTTPAAVSGASGKLPTVEELKELRDDIKRLRRDVQRLRESIEDDRR